MGRQVANLRVGVQATRREDEPKLPTNLVFLVDTSGSMASGDKLPLAQLVLRQTLAHLDPTDTVSIVSYAGDVAVRLEPTPANDPARIIRAIEGLTSGGATNGASGIGLAYDQAEAGFIEGGFNHVILCTDGDFNIGISDSDALVALIEEKRETGVTLTALGFGTGNLNDAMMERVTNAGNGVYSVLSSEAQATRYAAERILQTAQHVAKDMKIQVEFNPEHVVAYRLLGYENRALEDWEFRDDTVDAGEIGAGHRVTALYEIVLAGQSVPRGAGHPAMLDGDPVDGAREIDASEFVRVKVRWKDVGATTEDPAHELTSSLLPEDVTSSIEDADADLLWASSIVAFAEILKGSPFANQMDLPRIQQLISAQAGRDADRAAFVDHFIAARALLDAR
ncbi:MAG: Ca-activated chloride channel family protein [Polyangiales bacterium]|jgi:Ca-activated chloride channel family protein